MKLRAKAAAGSLKLNGTLEIEMGDTIKCTLTKSMIGSTKKIRATLIGLGLTRRQKTVIRKDTSEIRGMLRKVQHLVTLEEE